MWKPVVFLFALPLALLSMRPPYAPAEATLSFMRSTKLQDPQPVTVYVSPNDWAIMTSVLNKILGSASTVSATELKWVGGNPELHLKQGQGDPFVMRKKDPSTGLLTGDIWISCGDEAIADTLASLFERKHPIIKEPKIKSPVQESKINSDYTMFETYTITGIPDPIPVSKTTEVKGEEHRGQTKPKAYKQALSIITVTLGVIHNPNYPTR